MRLSLQPLICPADRFFGLLKLRRSDSYYRGKDVINDFSRALVLPYCDLPGYRKVGERLRASLSSQLDQLFQMPFVDQPRSFRGELSQRSFSFSILLFAFSRRRPASPPQRRRCRGVLVQTARLCVAAECARWASNADATLRTRNSAPSLIESRSSIMVTAPSAMRLSIRGRSTIADR